MIELFILANIFVRILLNYKQIILSVHTEISNRRVMHYFYLTFLEIISWTFIKRTTAQCEFKSFCCTKCCLSALHTKRYLKYVRSPYTSMRVNIYFSANCYAYTQSATIKSFLGFSFLIRLTRLKMIIDRNVVFGGKFFNIYAKSSWKENFFPLSRILPGIITKLGLDLKGTESFNSHSYIPA